MIIFEIREIFEIKLQIIIIRENPGDNRLKLQIKLDIHKHKIRIGKREEIDDYLGISARGGCFTSFGLVFL